MENFNYPYDNDPKQRPTESYKDYLARRLAAGSQPRHADPILAGISYDRGVRRNPDKADPAAQAAISDMNDAITEMVDHFAETWMTPGGEAHAREILIDWLKS